MDDEYFMRFALNEANAAASKGEIPVGAVIVHEGEIVGRGHNKRLLLSSPLAHAEMIALENAANTLGRWRFDDCTIYVTLEPCPMCAGALVQSRIRRLVYAANDPKAGASRSLYHITDDPRMPHRCVVKGGVLSAESVRLLGDFFKRKRRSKKGACSR